MKKKARGMSALILSQNYNKGKPESPLRPNSSITANFKQDSPAYVVITCAINVSFKQSKKNVTCIL
jgi:hypothetical protein